MQPQREPGPTHPQNDDDDVIIVDSPHQSLGKRKGGGDQPSLRPTKRKTFWVEVPPLPKWRRVLSTLVVPGSESNPNGTSQVIATAPTVKEEPDQEIANALAVVRNVRWGLNFLLKHYAVTLIPSPLFFADKLEERRESLGRCIRFYEALKDWAGNLPNNH